MLAPDITIRLAGPVDLADVKPLLAAAREEIIELRMLLSDRICTICAGEGHHASQCPWKGEGKNNG